MNTWTIYQGGAGPGSNNASHSGCRKSDNFSYIFPKKALNPILKITNGDICHLLKTQIKCWHCRRQKPNLRELISNLVAPASAGAITPLVNGKCQIHTFNKKEHTTNEVDVWNVWCLFYLCFALRENFIANDMGQQLLSQLFLCKAVSQRQDVVLRKPSGSLLNGPAAGWVSQTNQKVCSVMPGQ